MSAVVFHRNFKSFYVGKMKKKNYWNYELFSFATKYLLI